MVASHHKDLSGGCRTCQETFKKKDLTAENETRGAYPPSQNTKIGKKSAETGTNGIAQTEKEIGLKRVCVVHETRPPPMTSHLL